MVKAFSCKRYIAFLKGYVLILRNGIGRVICRCVVGCLNVKLINTVYIAYKKVMCNASARPAALEPYSVVERCFCHLQILEQGIMRSRSVFTSYNYTALGVMRIAVCHSDIRAGLIEYVTLFILTCLTRNSVVTCLEIHIEQIYHC